MSRRIVKIDNAGNVRLFFAIWPFGDGETFKRVEHNLYEGPGSAPIAFVHDVGSESYIASNITASSTRGQRVLWSLDVRWIAPGLVLSTAVVLLSLLAWPVTALWRRWRKRRWSQDGVSRPAYLAIRLVLLLDAAVVVATGVLFALSSDLTIFNDALDPLLLALYALAWLAVLAWFPSSGPSYGSGETASAADGRVSITL
jgi:hypothetical protein